MPWRSKLAPVHDLCEQECWAASQSERRDTPVVSSQFHRPSSSGVVWSGVSLVTRVGKGEAGRRSLAQGPQLPAP